MYVCMHMEICTHNLTAQKTKSSLCAHAWPFCFDFATNHELLFFIQLLNFVQSRYTYV